jgi:glycosyltransferase involved in cell wall biosynthesis
MVHDHRVVVIMPALNAEKTLEKTYSEVPKDIVDEIILVDDQSSDATPELSKKLGIQTIVHLTNTGYGGNQKTAYQAALKTQSDFIIMLHPDYQYSPKLITSMAYLLDSGFYDVVLGSRILGGGALRGGMPLYKYFFNRILTAIQNILMGAKLSEYHTGYRAYRRKVLEVIPYLNNSNDFAFDAQLLSQAIFWGFSIGEISCPTRYFSEASSINFQRSVKYGIQCLITAFQFRLAKWKLMSNALFIPQDRRSNKTT